MALIAVGAFPGAGAVAVGGRKDSADRARVEVERPVMVAAYGRTLVPGEEVAALVEDVDAAATVAAPVAAARLAEIVEECYDSDAV